MVYSFTAPLKDAGGGGMYVEVPFDVKATFGKSRVPVRATIGGIPYTGTLVKMGGACHMLLVLKAIREELGVVPGDLLSCTVEEDATPRIVTVPQDLNAALAENPDCQAFFESLAYTHQREYVNWVQEAKRPETRQRRILQTIAQMREGKRGR